MKTFSCAYKNKNKYKLDRYNVNYCCAIYVIIINCDDNINHGFVYLRVH